jgi:hypothetical protein
MNTKADVPEHLMEFLKQGRIGSNQLAELVRKVGMIQDRGVRPIRVFPIGLIYPDGIMIEALLERDQLSLINEIIGLEGIRSMEIFPKGLPAPDKFHAKIAVE